MGSTDVASSNSIDAKSTIKGKMQFICEEFWKSVNQAAIHYFA